MATLSPGYSFGATESVTAAKLATLVSSATISGIVNADLSAGAAIDESKISPTGAVYVLVGSNQTITGSNTFSGKNSFTGGIVIETRTSDPTSPTAGQIWLRSDL
jgi:hypothetical protein